MPPKLSNRVDEAQQERQQKAEADRAKAEAIENWTPHVVAVLEGVGTQIQNLIAINERMCESLDRFEMTSREATIASREATISNREAAAEMRALTNEFAALRTKRAKGGNGHAPEDHEDLLDNDERTPQ